MVVSLDHLPEEILHSILCHLHPRSAAALEQTSHRFENVTNGPLLWRRYCEIYYKSWDKKHEILQKLALPVSAVNWKALFVSRYHIDRALARLLDSILGSQTGRIEKFRAVIDYGYDAKDTLLRHSTVESGEDHLARRSVHPLSLSDTPVC
jgi:F-box protein 21